VRALLTFNFQLSTFNLQLQQSRDATMQPRNTAASADIRVRYYPEKPPPGGVAARPNPATQQLAL